MNGDVIQLIFEEVRILPELSSTTLFNAAITCRAFAPLALSSLYRSARSPGTYDELETGNSFESHTNVMKWAIYWRSIYLASIHKAAYPYHKSLRFLDLRDLMGLTEDTQFKGKVEKYFFSGSLQGYQPRLLPGRLVELFGDNILAENSTIEGLSGTFNALALQRWIPRMPRLRRLELWEGNIIANEATQKAIYKHCPHFEELTLLVWTGADADPHLGPFFSGLHSNTFKSLIIHHSMGLAAGTAIALNGHGKSLKNLQILLEPCNAAELGSLRDCTSLEKLHVELSPVPSLSFAELDPKASKEFSALLADCHKLRELSLAAFKDATELLCPMLLNDSVPLEDLAIFSRSPFFTNQSSFFNDALARKKTLRCLYLQGEAEDPQANEIEDFTYAVTSLRALRCLKLQGIMDDWIEEQVSQILFGLNQLEEVVIGGVGITDDFFYALKSLKHLRRITIMAISFFSKQGLLKFVAGLDDEGNRQIQINVDVADPDFLLSLADQDEVRAALKAKVNGTFEYTPLRDDDGYESSELSD